LRYTFYPTHSITIKPFEVIVDGITYKTPILHLNKIKPTASKPGDDFELILKTSKTKAYVGEPILLTLQFKYKNGANITDANLDDFKMDGLWVKKLQSPQPYQENGYIVYDTNYLIFAQKSGKIEIPNQKIDIASRDRVYLTTWKKVFSNSLQLDITPLPDGVTILGDYNIEASVDKTTTVANKPINLTIKLKGIGNIDDIDPFELNLKEQVVYSDKPQIKPFIKNNQYGAIFTQKISIVADKDFTIEPIVFKYFDIKTKKVKTIKTKPFNIKVKRDNTTTTPKIITNVEPTQKVEKIVIKENSNIKYIYGIVGFILGIISFIVFSKIKKPKTKNEKPISKKIKQAKNDKELYDILLPYSQNNLLYPFIKELENNLFNNKKNKINKKEIIDIFENID